MSYPNRLHPSEWVSRYSAFDACATQYNVNLRIVEGMVYTETRGNRLARGGLGETGLLQILPSTLTYLNRIIPGPPLDPKIPADCAKLATFYLNWLRDNTCDGQTNYVRMCKGYNGSIHYPITVASYLTMMAQATADDPAKTQEHAEYVEALDTMLSDADAMGKGAMFRRAVRANVSGSWGHEFMLHAMPPGMARIRTYDEQAAFRAGALTYITGDAGAAPRREAAPRVAATPPEDLAAQFNPQDKATLRQIAESIWAGEGVPEGVKVIRSGTEEARTLQTFLEEAGIATDRNGANGVVDGDIGRRTNDGIKLVEALLGLPNDGKLGQAEWEALQNPAFREALKKVISDRDPSTSELATAPARPAPTPRREPVQPLTGLF